MKAQDMICTAFIIDTYKVGDGAYVPGAVTFCKRKKIDVIHWVRMKFASQEEADEYVRAQLAERKLAEAQTELELGG